MIAAVQTSFTLRTVALGLMVAASASAQAPARKVTPLTAQDYIDIQQLLNRYAFALDTCANNGYDYADLYTPDGIFYWGIGGRKSIGREQLAEAAGGGKQGCQKLKTATDDHVASICGLFGERFNDEELGTLCDFLERLEPKTDN